MKTILLILILSIGLNSMASDPIKKEIPNKIYKEFKTPEHKIDAILMITTGIVILGLGIYNESIREPFPTHPTNINYNPNAERTINYMTIGAGLSFGLGGGIRLIKK